MNKILCNNKIMNIKIEKNSIINIGKDDVLEEINIELDSNKELVINHYSEIKDNISLKINIIEKDNCKFLYNYSFINNKNYKLNVNIELCGNKSSNILNINGISDGGNSNIVIDGKVLKNTKDNILDEKIKMLNINDGKSNILPNMYINTKNVIANHAASVTNINESYLFYLYSKGIEYNEARKLIIDGFLDNDAKS